MACNGCIGSGGVCNCSLQAGDNVTITGVGDGSNPYIINANASPAFAATSTDGSIIITPAGDLGHTPNLEVNPAILGGGGGSVDVSAEDCNSLVELGDGLFGDDGAIALALQDAPSSVTGDIVEIMGVGAQAPTAQFEVSNPSACTLLTHLQIPYTINLDIPFVVADPIIFDARISASTTGTFMVHGGTTIMQNEHHRFGTDTLLPDEILEFYGILHVWNYIPPTAIMNYTVTMDVNRFSGAENIGTGGQNQYQMNDAILAAWPIRRETILGTTAEDS